MEDGYYFSYSDDNNYKTQQPLGVYVCGSVDYINVDGKVKRGKRNVIEPLIWKVNREKLSSNKILTIYTDEELKSIKEYAKKKNIEYVEMKYDVYTIMCNKQKTKILNEEIKEGYEEIWLLLQQMI